jgi:N-sulfoglucosamine sulfohydrolase
VKNKLCVGLACLFVPYIAAAAAGAQPNFLIIMADDCTHTDLPLFGGQNAKTPHLDRLASEGLVFDHAYLSEAMCQPCRSELYSGQHPMRNGAAWNHSGSRPETTALPQHLGKLGYRVGLAGKTHITPKKAFPFESVGGFDPSCVRDPTREHDLAAVTDFLLRDDLQPFCLVIALVEPHVPWVMGDASKYPPRKIKLPRYLADTDLTREAYSRYLAEITYMDAQVGEILATLNQTGRADDTLVLFTSEQGSQFPGCKWTNWDNGLHTALIARWPGQVPVGERTDAIVQYADVAPTLVDLAGGSPDDFAYDGTSFQGSLHDSAIPHRKYAYGIHNNIPEGPAYPIRTITNGKYRYIRNLTPDQIYIEKHLMGLRGNGFLNNPYWGTWVFESEANPWTERLVKRYMQRPAEEFYHTEADPFELTNLVEDAAHASLKDELSAELDRWMADQGDPGIPLDTKEAHAAAKKFQHKY